MDVSRVCIGLYGCILTVWTIDWTYQGWATALNWFASCGWAAFSCNNSFHHQMADFTYQCAQNRTSPPEKKREWALARILDQVWLAYIMSKIQKTGDQWPSLTEPLSTMMSFSVDSLRESARQNGRAQKWIKNSWIFHLVERRRGASNLTLPLVWMKKVRSLHVCWWFSESSLQNRKPCMELYASRLLRC